MIPTIPPKAPRPWDPDAARTGSVVLMVGLVMSVTLHGGIPFGWMMTSVRAVSQVPVTMEIESIPLPPAEELVESPDDVDSNGPDDDTPPDTPNIDPTPDAPKAPDVPPVKDPPPDVEPPDPPPMIDEPISPPKNDAELAQRIAERERKRAEWLAERERRAAEREARRKAAREAREAARAKKGGAPESGKPGDPDAVYFCTATDKGEMVQPRTMRSITSWMSIVPTVFAHFDSRPGMSSYVGGLDQVIVPKRRIGFIDVAAPADVLSLPLDVPTGGRIAIGRLDARCVMGLKYRPRLFPIQLMRVPARIMKGNTSVAALVNINIYKDASIDIELHKDAEAVTLPYTKGYLKNSKAIARNIDDHFQAVRLANAFAELFGMKPEKPQRSPGAGTAGKATVKR